MFVPFYNERIPINLDWPQLQAKLRVASGKDSNPLKHDASRNLLFAKHFTIANKWFSMIGYRSGKTFFAGQLTGVFRKGVFQNELKLKFRPSIQNLMVSIVYLLLFFFLIFLWIATLLVYEKVSIFISLLLIPVIGIYFIRNRGFHKQVDEVKSQVYRVLES